MKSINQLMTILTAFVTVSCGNTFTTDVTVKDEAGEVIENAEVRVFFDQYRNDDEYSKTEFTDESGKVRM